MVEDFSLTAGLLGGMLIGMGAAVLLLLDGKIAGISGILGGLFNKGVERYWRQLFVVGLVAGAFMAPFISGRPLDTEIPSPGWLTVIAGLLVGFGTRLGNGCTSGHGVCGLARLSPRSLVATVTFILTAMLTVFIVNSLGGA